MAAGQKAISEQGIPAAIDFCNVNALPILTELGKVYSVQIKRASTKARNTADFPTDEERPIL